MVFCHDFLIDVWFIFNGWWSWNSQRCRQITAEIAKSKAETEFEKYRIIQDKQFIYDYDRYLLELEESKKE